MESNSKSGRRRFWQFNLRTLLLAITLLGILLTYGSHFWRLTLQARAHRDEAQNRADWLSQMMTVSFHIPHQYWTANEADLKWHSAKEQECLHARWFPWREVEETSLPLITETEEAWPAWTTQWRRSRK